MKYLILNEQMDTFCYETMRLLSHEKVLVQAESCSRGFVFDKVAEVGVTCIVISKTGICAAPYTRDKLQKCRDTKV